MKSNAEHDKLEKAFKRGKIPFAIDKDYKRFSERDMIFSRVGWDESYHMFMRSIHERENDKVGRIKGYTREGYAASSAAWTIYDKFPDAFSWGMNEDSIGSLTQKISTLPQYVSSNIDKNTDIVKRIAQVFGSCDTGISEIYPDKRYIYTHDRRNNLIEFPENIKYVIVMLIEMDYEALKTSPTLPAAITTGNAYSRMAFALACMAEFLRNLGYKAIPAGNDT